MNENKVKNMDRTKDKDTLNQTENDNDQVEFEDVTDTETPSNERLSDSNDVETEIADMKDQLLRALAEAENVRRRAAQDKEDALKYGVSSFARDILSVSDNLRRALDHVDHSNLFDDMKAFVEGVELTESEILKIFDKHGIIKVDPLGEKFDSNLHQAMFEQESDEHAPGIITQVMQPGYTLHGRLLRPAMVGVAKKK